MILCFLPQENLILCSWSWRLGWFTPSPNIILCSGSRHVKEICNISQYNLMFTALVFKGNLRLPVQRPGLLVAMTESSTWWWEKTWQISHFFFYLYVSFDDKLFTFCSQASREISPSWIVFLGKYFQSHGEAEPPTTWIPLKPRSYRTCLRLLWN